MKFGKPQTRRFGTATGAYSVVTNREHHDSQITLTDYEAELVVSHFGQDNIHVGNVRSGKEKAAKDLHLYPSGKKISLNLVYPKPEKPELRLYISSNAGFKPQGDQIWFIFSKNKQLWIGEMSERLWRIESSILKNDTDDFSYQQLLEEFDEGDIIKIKERDAYRRKRSVALERLELAGFKCEYDEKHTLFTSRYSGKPYLEAHHLIPMGLQKDFSKALDTVHNVFCLCPNCHRAVHHAEESLAKNILSSLSEKRPVLRDYSITERDLFSFYAVEEIE